MQSKCELDKSGCVRSILAPGMKVFSVDQYCLPTYIHFKVKSFQYALYQVGSVTRLGDLLDFGQVFKAFDNN